GSDKLRYELRASGEVTLYDSEIIDTRNNATDLLSQETSMMLRGSVLGALRYEPNQDLAFGLWLGVGPRYGLYDSTHVTPTGVTRVRLNATYSLVVRSRLRVHGSLGWGILSCRRRCHA